MPNKIGFNISDHIIKQATLLHVVFDAIKFKEEKTLAEQELCYIVSTYIDHGYNKSRTARSLDIGIRTLQRKLIKYVSMAENLANEDEGPKAPSPMNFAGTLKLPYVENKVKPEEKEKPRIPVTGLN